MKAISTASAARETKVLFVCSILSFFELITAGFITLTIARDPKNAFLFGFSILRVGLFVFMIALGVLALWSGVQAHRRKVSFATVRQMARKHAALALFARILVIGILVWAWVSLFASGYLFGRWQYMVERLQPLSIALGLSVLQVLLGWLAARRQWSPLRAIRTANRTAWISPVIFLLAVAGTTLLITLTKIGLKPDRWYWNVPGVPLSGTQYFPLLALLVASLTGLPALKKRFAFLQSRHIDLILMVGLYVGTAIVWNATPLLKHYDALPPTPPHFQPYPFSDARGHDSGAIAILNGYGINFHGYTDKPLYMVFLAFLHLFAGYDYRLLTILQVCVLAAIPPILYATGKAFHSRVLGLLLAVTAGLRLSNAILQSHVIDGSNPKLFLTEVPVLLGLALFVLFGFLWLKESRPRPWLALLTGGLLGISSLIRANPLLLFPAVGLLASLVMWKSIGAWLKNISLYTAGFLILVLPWVVTGVNPDGQPWMLLKFLDVINTRYHQPASFNLFTTPWQVASPSGARLALVGPSQALTLNPSLMVRSLANQSLDLGENTSFILNHTLHNWVSSVLALPDSLVYEDLNHLSQREYWQYGSQWQGELPFPQRGFVFFNLGLIAVGLATSWKRYRWAGLLPLVVFLVYTLALGFARNSGSRYIVPVDWIAFLYFWLGLSTLLTGIRDMLVGEQNTPAGEPVRAALPAQPLGNSLGAAVIALALLASLIPLANVGLPALMKRSLAQEEIRLAVEDLPPGALDGTELMTGEVLYPYYQENGDISFDLMTPSGVTRFSVAPTGLKRELLAGQQLVVGYRPGPEAAQVAFIVTVKNTGDRLVWSTAP